MSNPKVREPLMHIVKRDAMPFWKSALIRLIAILLALVVCGIVIVLMTSMIPGKEPLNPLKVYAGNALHLTIRAEDIAYKEEEYHVQFELTNVSGKELYNLSFAITGAEQYRVFTVGDNETRTQLTQEDFGSSMTKKIKTLKMKK